MTPKRNLPFWVNSVEKDGTLEAVHPMLRLGDIFACNHRRSESPQKNEDCDEIWDSILLANYMIDFEWLLHEAPEICLTKNKIVVLSGEKGTATHCWEGKTLREKSQAFSKVNPFLFAARTAKLPEEKLVVLEPPLPYTFGTHHTKMALLNNRFGLRVAIFTANFIYADWNQKTQGIYVQDFPLIAAQSTPGTYREPNKCGADFKHQLANYLQHCGLHPGEGGEALGPFSFNFLDNFDFSEAKVRLIASVPGVYDSTGVFEYGLGRLQRVQEDIRAGGHEGSFLSWQYSSQGSLDDEFLRSLRQAMLGQPLFSGKLIAGTSSTRVQVIYPTENEVRNSIEGWRGGASLPVRMSSCHPYINARLHRWAAARPAILAMPVIDVDDPQDKDEDEFSLSSPLPSHADAMPHLKSYAEVLPPSKEFKSGSLRWFLMTSANLSKAAWGKLSMSKGGVPKLMIRSYELGVLYPPSAAVTNYCFSCTPSAHAAGLLHLPSATKSRSLYCTPVSDGSDGGDYGAILLPYDILTPVPYASTKQLLEEEHRGAHPTSVKHPLSRSDIPWVMDAAHVGEDRLGLQFVEAMSDLNFYGNWRTHCVDSRRDRKRERTHAQNN